VSPASQTDIASSRSRCAWCSVIPDYLRRGRAATYYDGRQGRIVPGVATRFSQRARFSVLALVAASLALAGCNLNETDTGQTSTAPTATQAAACDPSYPDFCIPPYDQVGDLDCAEVAGEDFTVLSPDPHGFDADGDGVGCESS